MASLAPARAEIEAGVVAEADQHSWTLQGSALAYAKVCDWRQKNYL